MEGSRDKSELTQNSPTSPSTHGMALPNPTITYIVFSLDLGSFTNLVIWYLCIKDTRIQLVHTLETDLACNNQLCFFCKKVAKLM